MSEDKNETIFVDGLIFEKPNPQAPEFVKGKISINAEKLIPFIEKYKNEKGWVNIDLLKSKKGVLYLKLNTFKKSERKENNGEVSPDEVPF